VNWLWLWGGVVAFVLCEVRIIEEEISLIQSHESHGVEERRFLLYEILFAHLETSNKRDF
jgi:hypothetical protein